MSFRLYLKRAEIVFRIAIVVCMSAWTAQASSRPLFAPMQTNLEESDIDRLEKELQDPAKRLAAIAALADFGAMKLYQVGSMFFVDSDAKRGALRERAANLARMCNDIDTISAALDSADPRLQLWGLWCWNPDRDKPALSAGRTMEPLADKENRWHALMPKVRRLAKDSIYRSLAIDKLVSNFLPENREFLLSLIPTETSAGVVLQILSRTERRSIGEPSKRDERYNEELLRLLAHQDVKVRRDALADIGLNWNKAEIFHVRFSAEVSQRVEELRKSDDDEEKRLANWAAEGLEKIAKIWLDRDSAKK